MRRPSIREGLRDRPGGAHAWRQGLCLRLSLQVARETKSPMRKISTTSPYTSTYRGSRTDQSTERTYRHYWLSRRTCRLPQGSLPTCPPKECTLGRAFPLSLRNLREDKGGGIHRDGRAAPRGVDHERGRRART